MADTGPAPTQQGALYKDNQLSSLYRVTMDSQADQIQLKVALNDRSLSANKVTINDENVEKTKLLAQKEPIARYETPGGTHQIEEGHHTSQARNTPICPFFAQCTYHHMCIVQLTVQVHSLVS